MNSLKILSFMVILLFTVSCSEQKDFNSDEWKSWVESENSPDTRWLMHKDLLDNNDLETYNKKQILDLLGKPNSETNNEYYYQLGYTGRGINIGTMVVKFENDSVVDIKVNDG